MTQSLEDLYRIANGTETPQRAGEAMAELARLHREGREGLEINFLTAFEWAEKAAHLDSSEGYLEITKIVGTACLQAHDLEEKLENAVYVIGACDPETLTRFKRPQIALNVGIVCENAQEALHAAGRMEEGNTYKSLAINYFQLAMGLCIFESDQEAKKNVLAYATEVIEWLSSPELATTGNNKRREPLKHPVFN